MHSNIPYKFVYWADPVVHLLPLKSSTDYHLPKLSANNRLCMSWQRLTSFVIDLVPISSDFGCDFPVSAKTP